MIRLRNIKYEQGIAHCQAIIEDCSTPIELDFDYNSNSFMPFSLPNGYEKCNTHISMAKRFFEKTKKEDLPERKTIMWY